MLVKGLSQAILARGYVTTRVLLPQQDLSTGTLKLSLIPGVIRHVRFADEKLRGTWKTAFPNGDGELLNLRDLEQGLEQMKRVTSQDVSMQIVPADVPGESDVVLDVKRGKPWTVVASIDNSGTRATGRLQGNLSLGIDNSLGLNDIFNVGVSQDLEFGDKRLGSHGWNGFYSIPWGYWTATLSAYTNTYYQQIAGVNQTFVASGNSKTVDLKLNRVLSRSQNGRWKTILATIRAARGDFDQICCLIRVVYLAYFMRGETAACDDVHPYRQAEAALDACVSSASSRISGACCSTTSRWWPSAYWCYTTTSWRPCPSFATSRRGSSCSASL